MRWILVLVLVCGLGAAIAAGLLRGDPGIEIELGTLLVDPEGSRSEVWQRGRHDLPLGRRLRADGATVVTAPGLRFALEDGAALAYDGGWRILGGSLTITTTAVQRLGLERIEELVLGAQTRCALRARGERVDLSCLAGDLRVVRGDGRILEAAAGEGVLGEGGRWVLRQAGVGSGYGEDFEEGGIEALAAGWFHGRVEDRDDGSGQRVLASVADGPVQRISLRRAPGDFNAVRRCQARLWATEALTVTCIWIDQAGQVVATAGYAADAGWQDCDLRALAVDGTELPPGLRMGGWALTVDGGTEGIPALRLDHARFTP